MVRHEAVFQGSPTPGVHPPELDVAWILPKDSGPTESRPQCEVWSPVGIRLPCADREHRGCLSVLLPEDAEVSSLWAEVSVRPSEMEYENSPVSLSPACSVAELVPGVWKS